MKYMSAHWMPVKYISILIGSSALYNNYDEELEMIENAKQLIRMTSPVSS